MWSVVVGVALSFDLICIGDQELCDTYQLEGYDYFGDYSDDWYEYRKSPKDLNKALKAMARNIVSSELRIVFAEPTAGLEVKADLRLLGEKPYLAVDVVVQQDSKRIVANVGSAVSTSVNPVKRGRGPPKRGRRLADDDHFVEKGVPITLKIAKGRWLLGAVRFSRDFTVHLEGSVEVIGPVLADKRTGGEFVAREAPQEIRGVDTRMGDVLCLGTPNWCNGQRTWWEDYYAIGAGYPPSYGKENWKPLFRTAAFSEATSAFRDIVPNMTRKVLQIFVEPVSTGEVRLDFSVAGRVQWLLVEMTSEEDMSKEELPTIVLPRQDLRQELYEVDFHRDFRVRLEGNVNFFAAGVYGMEHPVLEWPNYYFPSLFLEGTQYTVTVSYFWFDYYELAGRNPPGDQEDSFGWIPPVMSGGGLWIDIWPRDYGGTMWLLGGDGFKEVGEDGEDLWKCTSRTTDKWQGDFFLYTELGREQGLFVQPIRFEEGLAGHKAIILDLKTLSGDCAFQFDFGPDGESSRAEMRIIVQHGLVHFDPTVYRGKKPPGVVLETRSFWIRPHRWAYKGEPGANVALIAGVAVAGVVVIGVVIGVVVLIRKRRGKIAEIGDPMAGEEPMVQQSDPEVREDSDKPEPDG